MAVTQSAIGFGTLLKVGDGGGPEAFTTLLENVAIEGPPLERDILDATHHESPDGYKEFLGGLKDGGEVSGEGNLVYDTTQTNLLTDFEAGTRRNFQILVPVSGGTKTWAFTGIIMRLQPTYPVDDRMTYSFGIKVTAKPTLT